MPPPSPSLTAYVATELQLACGGTAGLHDHCWSFCDS